MILTDHAIMRLKERYEYWGLDIKAATRFLMDLNISNPNNYEIVYIDTIPVVIVCNDDIIPTVYPHPLDMAVQTREYKQKNVQLLKTNEELYHALQREKKKADKFYNKNIKLKNKLRSMWK